MNNQSKLLKCISIIQDRVDGINNDLKAFLYIRAQNMQHSTPDNIGGGNLVMALSVFATLNFLGKVYYCLERSDKFPQDGWVNETEVFQHYMKFLNPQLQLFPGKGMVFYDELWKVYRDCLTHIITPKSSKSVVVSRFEDGSNLSIESLLMKLSKETIITEQSNRWELNIDVLYSKIPEILEITLEYIKSCKITDITLLAKVIDVEV